MSHPGYRTFSLDMSMITVSESIVHMLHTFLRRKTWLIHSMDVQYNLILYSWKEKDRELAKWEQWPVTFQSPHSCFYIYTDTESHTDLLLLLVEAKMYTGIAIQYINVYSNTALNFRLCGDLRMCCTCGVLILACSWTRMATNFNMFTVVPVI